MLQVPDRQALYFFGPDAAHARVAPGIRIVNTDAGRTAPGVAPPAKERQWAVIAHLSAMLLYAGLLGGLLGPLLIWLIFRADMPFVDDQGRETLNFQITVALLLIAGGVLFGVGVLTAAAGGWLLAVVAVAGCVLLIVVHFVLTIVAAIQAGEGVRYRYPYCWRPITAP